MSLHGMPTTRRALHGMVTRGYVTVTRMRRDVTRAQSHTSADLERQEHEPATAISTKLQKAYEKARWQCIPRTAWSSAQCFHADRIDKVYKVGVAPLWHLDTRLAERNGFSKESVDQACTKRRKRRTARATLASVPSYNVLTANVDSVYTRCQVQTRKSPRLGAREPPDWQLGEVWHASVSPNNAPFTHASVGS
ncbi:hypothetical protein K466DRAFT_380714 [Polyporus arcularius HHB13444]|uniref:Uncharacterized protein n=1 Tax=Polyporus arcularius HHB13444 TaxID=1314778 RepID=A0A5C3PWU1_9APHY|nr:hypothetical protein K466DRAFT_380714 [Polyporus arcularius HHB13444]